MASALPQPLSFDDMLATMRGFAIAGCDRVATESDILNTDFFVQNSAGIVTDPSIVRSRLADLGSIQTYNSHDLYPLPFKNADVLVSFFRPKFFLTKSAVQIELAMISKSHPNESWGFRLEFGNRGVNDIHGFDHIQSTKSLIKGSVITSLPIHLAGSSPAFPIPSRQQFSTWLLTLIAINGASASGKGLLDQFDNAVAFFDVPDPAAMRGNLQSAIEHAVTR